MFKIIFLKLNLFQILNTSNWAFYVSLGSINIVLSFLIFLKLNFFEFLYFSFFLTLILCFFWWKDICKERKKGEYRFLTVDNLKLRIIIFIFREICFFSGFFWSFFHYSLIPAVECGRTWPPFYLNSINPLSVPLLNTIVLLRRGVTVTISHIIIINNFFSEFYLLITIILGLYFTFLQGFEYIMCSFSIRDSVYGSVFFISTGFHGIHVLVGTLFLIVCLFRLLYINFSSLTHLGFEIAIWYWHFVDVIWIFLFLIIYF